MRVATAMGSTIQKMKRQLSELRMSPEIVGPTAGATEITMEMLPIIRPRLDGGTSVITVVMSSGSMMAVPLACTTRASRSTGNPGASAAMSVPALNSDMATPKRTRVGKPLDEVSADRDDHGHREQERRRQPLADAGFDAEVLHDARKGDAHDRLVEDDHEGRDKQQADECARPRAEAAVRRAQIRVVRRTLGGRGAGPGLGDGFGHAGHPIVSRRNAK